MFRLVCLCLALTACEPEPTTWVEQTQQSRGTACVQGGGQDPVRVQVNADVCLSSSCSRNPVARCEARIEFERIVVTSSFTWEEAEGGDLACTDDCGQMIASCAVGQLPAGNYVLLHGPQEVDIELPAEECTPPI